MEIAYGFIAFNCPVTETGHHDVTNIISVGPKWIIFRCPVCNEKHKIDVTELRKD